MVAGKQNALGTKLIDRIVNAAQALLLSYRDLFFYVAVLAVVSMPLVLLLGSKQDLAAEEAAGRRPLITSQSHLPHSHLCPEQKIHNPHNGHGSGSAPENPAPPASAPPKKKRGPLFYLIVTVCAIAAGIWLVNFIHRAIVFEETDDSYINGHVHQISFRVQDRSRKCSCLVRSSESRPAARATRPAGI